jgi:hypothetical protein
MVIIGKLLRQSVWAGCILAAEPNESPLKRLDPAQRAKVMMAMISLLVIAIVLVLVAWLFARAARHYVRRTLMSPCPRTNIVPDDWANKPLIEFDDQTKSNDQTNE